MTNNRLLEVTAPFRRDIQCVFSEAFQFDDVFIRFYSAAEKDPRLEGPVAAVGISNLPFVKQLMVRIGYEHRDQYHRLCGCLQQLKLLLEQQAEIRKFYSGCNTLLCVVKSIQLLISCSWQRVHETLLGSLQTLLADSGLSAGSLVTDADIDAVIVLIEHFKDELQRFCDEMEIVLYGDQRYLPLQIDEMLLKEQLVLLLTEVERSIIQEDDLQACLETWKRCIEKRDLQQLLN